MDIAKVAVAAQARLMPSALSGGRGTEAAHPVAPQQQTQEPRRLEDLPEAVAGAVERIREQVQNLQRNLNFSVDDSTGQVVVQVVDGESGTVVRQIPSEDILRLAERLDEMRSLLFEAKA
jgi:flagellar protein FlaG